MLQITIPAKEQWDEANQTFVNSKEQTLQLEHSLLSLSRWESKWCKSFFSKKEKTNEEILDYIRCMTLTKNVDEETYTRITKKELDRIIAYIEAPMTAIHFSNDNSQKSGNDTITSDVIYYWMVTLNIPFECEKWHINRLFALIRVCNIKNQPPKKMSKRELANRNASLNAARRKQLNTKG